MISLNLKTTSLVASLLIAGVVGGAGVGAFNSLHTSAMAATQATPVSPSIGRSTLAIAPPDFSQITERFGPAVVNISVTGSTKVSDEAAGQDDDAQANGDPFGEFFHRFQPGQGIAPGQRSGQASPRQGMPTRGQGSGFIVSSDGIILTNAHVVKDAKEVTVKLTDRREFRAKVLGSDPKTDVAVLRIEAKNLPVVSVGKTSDLRVGEWVLAIGSPFGFENTVTAGVVSAKGRSLPDDSAVPFIQTDVAINPGNSGGPLFNAHGEVVGINSQIYSRTGGYQGVSFAIPIDLAGKIKDQIIATGKAEHARLGIAVQEVNEAFADSFKLDKPEGALISNVEKGGPADKAGLQSGDVIRSVNGQPIVTSGDLPAVISVATPGQNVQLNIWRQGASKDIAARLGNINDKANAKDVDVVGNKDPASQGKLGLALRPLQPEEWQESGLSSGLVVQQASGPAAMAGVQSGDLLISINGVAVKNIDQVRRAVANSPKSVALLIQRGNDKIFVPVNIG